MFVNQDIIYGKEYGCDFMSSNENIARKMLNSGFFPKEVPSEFVSATMSEKLESLDLSKSRLSSNTLNKWTKLIDISVPKGDNFRRTVSIPHPLHYILLANLIEQNWETLEDHFLKSEYSLTTPKNSDTDRIRPRYEMSEKIKRRIDNLALKRYILQLDISRYYPSIYTHAIPWALHTKEYAKSNTKSEIIGNNIDKLVRNMQDGQTIGIPIGPISSLIIQEIIGVAIDVEFKEEYSGNLKGFRYTDDMEYYFSSSEEAERALNIINKILKKYELDINVNKTKIIKIPQVLEPEWKFYFKRFKFRVNNNSIQNSILLQRTDLMEYFSGAFKFKSKLEDKGILNYALKVIRNVVIHKENWDLFESLLFQSILVDPSIIPVAFEIIESYKYRSYPLDYDKILEFVNAQIRDNIEFKNDYEVFWALSFAVKLDIPLIEDVAQLLLKNDNAIVNVLVMILNSKGLLSGELDFSYYKSLLVDDSLYNSSWLFYYECCVQGWLGKDKDDQCIKDDRFFSQLLNCSISFIDSNHSKVLEELKHSIISICIEQYNKEENCNSTQDILQDVIKEYSFSLENELIDDIGNRLDLEINKLEEQPGTEREPEQPGTEGEPEQPGTEGEPEQPGTEREPEQPGTEREPEQPGTEREPEQPGTEGEPEQPGTEGEPEQPGTEREPEQPGTEREPEQPGTEREPEQPGTEGEPEQPGTEGEPEQPGTEREPEQPGTEREPEQPGTEREPEQPGTEGEPEQPGTEGEPEQPGTEREPEQPGTEREPEQSGTERELEQPETERELTIKDNWIFNFLTTNINRTSRIRNRGEEDEY
ncbi:RNA-directed DNA polymerase [Paenibacillus sp. LK1]|uniref:RNA-directed DNA polymerase n=1 Tax=Paenibacillus sp. LK1 TaxID=2053014 RepID=UPI000C17FCBB|nr:RNA-directed DNA polymerase [Paenibacillus sp. LK1]PIH57827.1 hypothetical protein CS562_18565 [Paenibacillus sp. LK1]